MFSFGIILLECIGRIDADPDLLPRTSNFGVDYVAYAANVAPPDVPSKFLRHAFTCVQVINFKIPRFQSFLKGKLSDLILGRSQHQARFRSLRLVPPTNFARRRIIYIQN